MNIQYIKSNLSKLSNDNVIKFLYDLLLQNMQDVDSYIPGKIYNKGDRVYLQENGKHQVFQCIVIESSDRFDNEEWQYIMEVYEGSYDKVYNLFIKEEVHIIDEETTHSFTTNLEFKSERSRVALYCGKKRYVVNHDFVMNGNVVNLVHPFNVGDRVILEVREGLGVDIIIGVIIYSPNGIPYNITIDDNGNVTIEEYPTASPTDTKYGSLVTGDRTYTLMVDDGVVPPELRIYEDIETIITGSDDKLYNISVNDGKVVMTDVSDKNEYSDTKVIKCSDGNLYTLGLDENGNVIANIITDENVKNIKDGLIVFDENYDLKIIDVVYGQIIIRDYIDNTGYNVINLIDIYDGKNMHLTISDDSKIELVEGFAEGLTGSQPVRYYYFYDDNWIYNRLYVEKGELKIEYASQDTILDYKGIILRKPNQELVNIKFPFLTGEEVYLDDINNKKLIYSSLNFEDKVSSELFRLVATDEHELEMYSGNLNEDPTGSEVVEHFYFFDEDCNYNILFVENGDLMFMTYNQALVKNTIGINVINPDGEMSKIRYNGNELYVNELVNGSASQGTFMSPIEGFVVMVEGVKKLVTVNVESNGFELRDTKYRFKTNHHYIMSQDDRVYKLNVDGDNTNFVEYDTTNVDIENIGVGTFIKANEMITKIEINDDVTFIPISTFVHRIRCVNGLSYLLDIVGEPGEEIVEFSQITDGTFNKPLSAAEMYLQDNHGYYYKVNLDEIGYMNFELCEPIEGVDYEITSLINSSQGWYQIFIEDNNVRIIGLSDELYPDYEMAYGNIVKKDLVLTSINGKEFSVRANGLGEIDIVEVSRLK